MALEGFNFQLKCMMRWTRYSQNTGSVKDWSISVPALRAPRATAPCSRPVPLSMSCAKDRRYTEGALFSQTFRERMVARLQQTRRRIGNPLLAISTKLSRSSTESQFLRREVMPFGQLVIGPPGAGKSTYCYGLQSVSSFGPAPPH